VRISAAKSIRDERKHPQTKQDEGKQRPRCSGLSLDFSAENSNTQFGAASAILRGGKGRFANA
jgi:hypothetical protein